MKGDIATAMLSLLLAGPVLGFLRYNFNGARIFLGDSGSLFIGFCLAILSMQSSTKGSAAFSILVPMLTLGLPIMDTLLAMVRRFLRSVFPEQKNSSSFSQKLFHMFLPDRGHIHHQLIARGLSHRNVVLLLYVVSCLFGVGAFAVTATNNLNATPILLIIGIATFIGVSQLRYKEMAVLRNGILLPLYEWPLMNSAFFQGFLDLAFIIGAYSGAFYIIGGRQFNTEFFQGLMVVSAIQLLVFYMNGLYKGTFRQLGMGDLLKIVKTITLSVVLTWIVFAVFSRRMSIFNTTLIILDYYFLLSLVIGERTSYHVLHYLFQRDHRQGKHILIYGAEERGVLTLQQILNEKSLNLCPIGFLDDNPNFEGKTINSYPVFGGHWKLEYLINKMDIREIVIATDYVKPEIIKRIQKISRLNGVTMRRLKVQLEDYEIQERHPSFVQERMVFLEKQSSKHS
jgi:UDP-GlcNAc:undecaprenyl-phosphate GlcNAc-1-phosphate transferase